LIVAIATTRAMSRYANSTDMVSHTHQVETAVESIRADLYSAENSCLQYVFTGRPEALQQFEAAADALPGQFSELRSLTADNPGQRSVLAALDPLIHQQIAFLRTSAAMKDKGGSAELLQEFSANGQTLSQQIFSKLAALRLEQERLLSLRTIISAETYATQKLVLTISFFVVLLFTILNFIELMLQLRHRKNAEQVVRRLSGRMLQVQDEERRKLARDLHDGIGQIFAALKMELNRLRQSDSHSPQESKIISSSVELVDEGLNQSRTISYLLHPPMLDEVGFSAAAKWLVDGFSQRSKIAVTLVTPEDLKLPRELELTLFRVLQESLTNIHRHSASASADVVVSASARSVNMTITDYGKGIPGPILENFRTSKSPSGVGLAGMRGRVADMDGKLELECPGEGTVVRVSIPCAKASQAAQISSTPPTVDGLHVPPKGPKDARGAVSVDFGTLKPLP
jgi:signal transduction histidine kinase